MSVTVLQAANATNGASLTSGNDGTFVLSVGPAGSPVTAMSIDASGNMTIPAPVIPTPTGITSINGGQLAGLRNRIINGGMQIAQRAAVLPSAAYQYGQVDRHMIAIVGGTGFAGSITQWTGLAGVASGYACGVNASWTAGNFNLQHRIEAVNCIDLNSKTITISCKAYQNTGGARNFKISLVKANSVDNHGAQTSLFTSGATSVPSGVTTPLSYTVTLGASDASNGIAVYVLDSDAANTVVSKLYLIGELQIEVGSVATTFEQRPIGLELALCQRYLPSWQIAAGYEFTGQCFSATSAQVFLPYPVTPRVAATGISSSQSVQCTTAAGSLTGTGAITFASAGLSGVTVSPTSPSTLVAGNATCLIATTTPSTVLATGCEL